VATIISTAIESIPRGNGQNYVVFVFTLDNGDLVMDGPRFLDDGIALNAKAAEIGAALLEVLAQAEVTQWLA